MSDDDTRTAGERRELTQTERVLLEIEGRYWVQPGAKDQEIIDRTGLSPTRAYQTLNSLVGEPAAWEAYPSTMRTLERRRGLYSRSRRTRLAARDQR